MVHRQTRFPPFFKATVAGCCPGQPEQTGALDYQSPVDFEFNLN